MNLEELNKLAAVAREKLAKQSQRICVCSGSSCMSGGSQAVMDATKKALKDAGLDATVQVVPVGCMGACSQGPLLRLEPDGTTYQRVDAAKAVKIVEKHVKNGAPLADSLLFGGSKTADPHDVPFYKKQFRVVRSNCGVINPEEIEEYIARDGYLALQKAVVELGPEEVIGEVKMSGLRGRGGAGFPTGNKWETVYRHVADQKYVICNGDEGDPGAFMDRSVLESDPPARDRRHDHRGLRRGGQQGIHLRARGVPPGHQAPGDRPEAGPQAGAAGQGHLRPDRLQLRHRDPHRRGAPSSAARRRR